MTAKYRNVAAEVLKLSVDGTALTVEGVFWFTLAAGTTAREACDQITNRGKQLAVLIGASQRIDTFDFRNGQTWVPYAPSERVARECAAGVNDRFGLGELAGQRWVGFELGRGVTITPETQGGDRMGYGFRFTLENYRTRFQVIPILHACLDLPIAQYHVVSVVVARITNQRISCSIDSTQEERGT